ncbi:MAG TPA: PaaI family thioesterase [Methanospirillum sp.]|nr:PaaI family thioesterase [Methanospirillum sp.]
MPDGDEQSGMSYLHEIQMKGKGANPFFCLLGIEPVSWGEGCARLEMEVRSDMTNGEGWLQGGMYTALADEAMALAIYTLLEDDQTIATISCTTHFLRGVKHGLIAAEGKVIRQGRQIIFAEGIVSSGGGETELARCSASFAVRRS